MCLIGLHYKALPGTVLLLAANRDEYYRRPSAALGPWPDQPEVLVVAIYKAAAVG